ncbi:CNDH2 protein, partial [Steatornis caripensis]|nr:CNDH2 protein [Steatornis caripensis]
MEEVESRFMHLLQPIRDLTKNWEVDVAAQLGEYLEELEHICISFDNGKTTMNFIEAALLIQGSACIYSRKVEYLYSLVYQTLDFISNKKREKQPSSVGQDGKDADASFGEEEEEFLSLDDIRDSSQANVDLKKDHQPNAVNIVPLTPMSLVPPEEAEKRDNPLFSRKGEILASRKDFRMNTCTPHTTGAFLLELAGLSPTCLQERQRRGSHGGAAGTGARGAGGRPAAGQDTAPGWGGNGGMPGVCTAFDRSVAVPGAAGPDDDDSRGDDMPGVPEDGVEMAPAAKEHVEAQRSAPRAKGYVLRERAPAEDHKAHVKEMLDPWQSLDPFSDSEDKPFKRGRPFLVPHGLDDVVGGKRKRKGPRKLQDFMKWFSAACEYRGRCRRALPGPGTPSLADLEGLYWKQLRERVAAQRKLQSRAVSGHGRGKLGPLGPLPALAGRNLGQGGSWPGARTPPVCPPGHQGAVGHSGAPCGRLRAVLYQGLAWPPCEEELELLEEECGADGYAGAGTAAPPHPRPGVPSCPLPHPLCPQEERAAFDIHGYGDVLAGSCGALGQWCSFASVVAGQPAFEVCRYMLASLQLANDYVVELAQDPGLEQALDTMRLRLLTHQRPHDRFRAFQPPSTCP